MNLTFPLALLALLPIVGVLVWAYRRHGKGAQRTIGTLFLFERLSERPSFRQQFKPPLRFFFDLVLLALLALALTGPFFTDDSREVVYLLDNSLSMAAPSEVQAISRLERAKQEVRDRFATAGSDVVFSIFKTSPRLELIERRVSSPALLDQVLAEIQMSYGEDRLTEALSQLRVRYPETELRAVTDRGVANDSSRVSNESTQIVSVRGPVKEIANLAVSGATLERNESAKLGTLTIRLQSFSSEPASIQVTVFRLVPVAGRVQEIKVRSFEENFSSEDRQKVVALPQMEIGYGYRVVLAPDNEQDDRFPYDNSYWVALEERRLGGAIVTSRSKQGIGVQSVRAQEISVLSLEEYQNLRDMPEWVVFDQVAVSTLPSISAAYVFPALESTAVRASPLLPVGGVTSWEKEHPLLRYLNFSAFSLTQASSFQTPPWASSLLETERGTILAAGEYRGNRYAFFGFDLFPLSSSTNPVGSILFFNAIQWLSADSLHLSGPTVGAPIRLSSRTEQANFYDGVGVAVVTPTEKGELVLSRPGMVFADSEERIPINFFSAAESELSNFSDVVLPPEPRQGGSLGVDSAEIDRPLWRLLVWLALFLLLLERVFMFIRAKRSVARS